ncbi:hypothetical protein THAOC_11725 [Thalassiosira oceanica]|uniref:Uncharacterized protein n=1 Tax=Thalassiosira oceanica TaxID=159749 RepID=K0T9S5_THAOC|nr:hypothetical protein THAOC_11725 [Thalassiosira oceanica]|eukprot:EJK67272.1 hypothetical protein THAOC_11725 [Thalassiosira oceanica]
MPSSDGDGASRPVAPPPPRKIRAGDLGDASHRRGAEPSSGAGRRQASKKHKKRLESQDEGAKDVPRDRAGDGDASAARRRPKPPEVEAKPPKAEGDDDYERLRRAARAAKVAKSEPSAAKDLPEAADEKERDMSVARDIPGEFLIVPKPAKGKEDDGPIRVVLGMHHVATPVRGLVLLLHDCGGSAFDFFARGDKCEECLGLSEEMRTARLVLLNGYLPMAVSSADARSGCWSAEDDADRFRKVLALEDLGGYHIGAYAARSVVAIGAGRGGAFAAELARNELTEFALVIASGLDDGAAEELAGREVQSGRGDLRQDEQERPVRPDVVPAEAGDVGLPRRACGGDERVRRGGAGGQAGDEGSRLAREGPDPRAGPVGVGLEGRPDPRDGERDALARQVSAGGGEVAAGQGPEPVLGVPGVLQRGGGAGAPVLRVLSKGLGLRMWKSGHTMNGTALYLGTGPRSMRTSPLQGQTNQQTRPSSRDTGRQRFALLGTPF